MQNPDGDSVQTMMQGAQLEGQQKRVEDGAGETSTSEVVAQADTRMMKHCMYAGPSTAVLPGLPQHLSPKVLRHLVCGAGACSSAGGGGHWDIQWSAWSALAG